MKSCRPDHRVDSGVEERDMLLKYELRYSAEEGVHESQTEARLLVRADFRRSLEIHLGTPANESESRLVLAHGDECPQLEAEYILFQPGVVASDVRRGWLPLGGLYPRVRYLGVEDSPDFELGAGVAPDHASVSMADEGIWITDGSTTKTEVRVHPDDVLLWSR